MARSVCSALPTICFFMTASRSSSSFKRSPMRLVGLCRRSWSIFCLRRSNAYSSVHGNRTSRHCSAEGAPGLFRNALPTHLFGHMVEVGTHTGEGQEDSAGTKFGIAESHRSYPAFLLRKVALASARSLARAAPSGVTSSNGLLIPPGAVTPVTSVTSLLLLSTL